MPIASLQTSDRRSQLPAYRPQADTAHCHPTDLRQTQPIASLQTSDRHRQLPAYRPQTDTAAFSQCSSRVYSFKTCQQSEDGNGGGVTYAGGGLVVSIYDKDLPVRVPTVSVDVKQHSTCSGTLHCRGTTRVAEWRHCPMRCPCRVLNSHPPTIPNSIRKKKEKERSKREIEKKPTEMETRREDKRRRKPKQREE